MADANPTRGDRSGARSSRAGRPATATRRSTQRGAGARPAPTGPSVDSRRPAARRNAAQRTVAPSVQQASTDTSTPATVWAPGAEPVDAAAIWPASLMAQIVTAFSQPGERVVLLPWPTLTTSAAGAPGGELVGPGGVIAHAPDEITPDELAATVTTIQGLERSARVMHLDPLASTRVRASRPFWADLVGHGTDDGLADTINQGLDDAPDHNAANSTGRRAGSASAGGGIDGGGRAVGSAQDSDAPGSADLVITSLPIPADADPDESRDGGAFELTGRDLIAPAAARLLRAGGILVVLTHSDWSRGWLRDPTGPVIAAGQNADLLYLQHIVALHTPVRGGALLAPPDDDASAEQYPRTAHRAHVRGLPAPHRRSASDLLVFSQPHDGQRAPLAPGAAAWAHGVIR